MRDADDDCILELAANSGAMIVTHNARDFHGAERLGVIVIAPKDFLRIIGGKA